MKRSHGTVFVAVKTLTCLGRIGISGVGELAELWRLKLLPDWLQELIQGNFHRGLQVSGMDHLKMRKAFIGARTIYPQENSGTSKAGFQTLQIKTVQMNYRSFNSLLHLLLLLIMSCDNVLQQGRGHE